MTYERTAYRANVIEHAFNRSKRWRWLATRYDKHAIVNRGGLVLAAVRSATDLGDTSYVSRIRGHQLGTARRYSSYSRPKRRRNAGSSYQWTNDHTVAPNTTA